MARGQEVGAAVRVGGKRSGLRQVGGVRGLALRRRSSTRLDSCHDMLADMGSDGHAGEEAGLAVRGGGSSPSRAEARKGGW